MEIIAKARYIHMSPKKVRLVLDVIRGMDATEAENQLKFIPKQASRPILKLLNSAVANAKENYNLEKEDLYIKKIRADEGPILRRWAPKAYGRATPIRKRSSHIIVILGEKQERQKSKKSTKALIKEEGFKKLKEVKEKPKSKPIKIQAQTGLQQRGHWIKSGAKKAKGLIKKVSRRKAG